MSASSTKSVEGWIRRPAYDALSGPEGLHGSTPSRDALLRSLAKDGKSPAEETAETLRAMVVRALET